MHDWGTAAPTPAAAIGKEPSGAAAEIRQAIEAEKNMLRATKLQAMANPAAVRPEIPEPLEFIAQTVLSNAFNLYETSCQSLTAICNPVEVDQPNRQYDGAKGDLVLASRYLDCVRNNILHIRRVVGVFVLCLFLGGVAIAQKPAAPAPAAAAPAEDNIACGTKVQPTTGLTECEMLRISNYVAQINALQTEAQARIKPVTDAGNEFIGKVVARNPGKQYESPSQQFPLGRLVPIPPPPPTPAATTPPPAAPAVPPAKQ